MSLDDHSYSKKAFDTLSLHCDYIYKKLYAYESKMKRCQDVVMDVSQQCKVSNKFLENILQTHMLMGDILKNVLIALEKNESLQAGYKDYLEWDKKQKSEFFGSERERKQ